MNINDYNNRGVSNYSRAMTKSDEGSNFAEQIHSNQTVDQLMMSNEMLKRENEELKELCVYLDEERERLENLLKEHQKFGKMFFSSLQVSHILLLKFSGH